MSVIYKSLKEIKGMKKASTNGGGMRPPKKPGSRRALIVVLAAVAAATLILGITGYWIMTELEQSGPDIAARKDRPRTRHPSKQEAQDATPARPAGQISPADREPSDTAPAGIPGNISAETPAKAQSASPSMDPLEAPVNATVVVDGPAPQPPAESDVESDAESVKDTPKKAYSVTIPAEPPSVEEKAAVQERNFISKVQRNQRVMALQKKMNRARRRNDAAAVSRSLTEITKLLGSDSFLVLQWQGNLAVMDKEYDVAERKYRRALTRKPHDLHCRMNLALTLIGGGKFRMADRELGALQADYPENPGVEQLRALLVYRMSHTPPKPLINDLHKKSASSPDSGNTSATTGDETQTSVQ